MAIVLPMLRITPLLLGISPIMLQLLFALRKDLKTIHIIIFCFITQSNKFLFKIALARGLSFCSFVIQCNNPTYNPSSRRLIIILIAFFSARWFGIAFVLSWHVTTSLTTPAFLNKGAWVFSLLFGCNILIYYLSYLIESFSNRAWHFCLHFCLEIFSVGNKLPLLTLVNLYVGGPGYLQSQNCSCFRSYLWGILFHLHQMLSILSLHSSKVSRQRGFAIEVLSCLWVWQPHLLL